MPRRPVRRPRMILLTALAAAAVALAAPRAGAAGPEDWLPPGTLVHLRADNPRRLLASLADHPFAALANEPEIVAFAESLAKRIPEANRADAAVRAFEVSTILSVLSGPVTLSVLGFAEAGTTPDVLLTVGVSEPKAFESGISLGVTTLVANTPGARSGSYEHGGATIGTIDHPQWHAAHALVGSTFVLSNRNAAVEAAIAALRGATAGRKSLATSESFRSVFESVGAGEAATPGVFAYVNVGAFLPRMLSRAPSARRAFAKAVGLGGVTAMGWRLTVEKGGMVDRLAFASPGGFGGILGSVPVSGRGLDAAAHAPANSLVSMAWQVDPVAAWDSATSAIREESPVAHEVLTDDLRAFEKGFGQGFRDSILGAMTGEMRLTAALRAESAARPDVDLVIGVRDAEAMRRAARRFSETIEGVDFRAIEFDGETLFVPSGDEAALAALAPSFCATGDALIVSVNPDSLKRALGSRKTRSETLETLPEWKDLAARVSTRVGAPFGAQYFDGRQAFSLAYNALVPVVQTLAGPLELPIDAALIPSVDAITRHISPSICAVSRTDGTVTVTSFGPLPSPAGPIALAGMGVALFDAASRGELAAVDWVAPAAARAAESRPSAGSAAPVTIVRSDAPLAEVLEAISRDSGLQYVAPEPLLRNRRVSLRIEAVPAREAFEIVCQSAGLTVTERALADGRRVIVISER